MVDLMVLAENFERLANEDIKHKRNRLIRLSDILTSKLGHPLKIDAPDMSNNQWYWAMANAIADGSERRSSLREPLNSAERLVSMWLDLAMDMRL